MKVKIELTEEQLKYLSVALFEFGEVFPSVPSEYFFKTLTRKLELAKREIEEQNDNN